MSYQVLSLKWRPQSFEDLVGQDHVARTLTNAFKRDRVAQAYLLTGPRGVGKTTTARIIAKVLNCRKLENSAPCNKCSNCMEITEGRNLDVLEIDGASNRGIEEIRNLREVIKYAPMNSPYKIFIIDEVHMLTTPAFNALLRTLEEPPAHGKFILATTDVHKVPATIISRCQRFDFNRISNQVIEDRITEILKSEKIKIDAPSLTALAQKADGSMRDGLSLLDQVIAFAGDEIRIDRISEVLGLIPIQIYFNITDALVEKDGARLLHELQSIKKSGLPVTEIASGLNQHFRDLLYCKIDPTGSVISMGPELTGTYIQQAERWDKRDLLRMADMIGGLVDSARRATQPYLMLELVMLKLLELDTALSIETLLADSSPPKRPLIPKPAAPKPAPRVDEKTAKPSATILKTEKPAQTVIPVEKPVETPASRPPSETPADNVPADKKDLDINTSQNQWFDVVRKVGNRKKSLAGVMEHTTVKDLKGSILTLAVNDVSRFHLNQLENGRAIIEEVIESVYGKALRFQVEEMGKPESAGETEPVIPSKPASRDGDAVSRIIELFDGEIIK